MNKPIYSESRERLYTESELAKRLNIKQGYVRYLKSRGKLSEKDVELYRSEPNLYFLIKERNELN